MKKFLVFVGVVFHFFIGSAQVVHVNSATEFENALLAAAPGQTIELADGLYIRSGGFYVPAGINGTNMAPIKVVGTSHAIISSDNLTSGYGLGLQGNSHWILEGFTIYNSKKGIVLDNSHFNVLTNITVKKIGDEGIHLRTYSSYNTVQNCNIDSLGLVSTCCGEGIYVGSSKDNWITYTNGDPDTCNYNVMKSNVFGDHIVSENIDIKEGTTGGIIKNNSFNGTGLNNLNGGDSWIDVKGNHYSITCNTGHNSILDGFQTHILVAGWGNYNTFSNNTLNVSGPGYGIKIVSNNTVGSAYENKVCSNNISVNSVQGLTNINTQICGDICDGVPTMNDKIFISEESTFSVYPNPFNDNLTISLPQAQSGQFKIVLIDVLGNILLSENFYLKDGSYTFNTQSLSKGIYSLVILNDESFMTVVKVVK